MMCQNQEWVSFVVTCNGYVWVCYYGGIQTNIFVSKRVLATNEEPSFFLDNLKKDFKMFVSCGILLMNDSHYILCEYTSSLVLLRN